MTHAEFEAKLREFHPTREQAYEALQKFINGEHSLHVPPMVEDADMVIGRVIDERDELREKVNKLAEALERLNKVAKKNDSAFGLFVELETEQHLADYRGTKE